MNMNANVTGGTKPLMTLRRLAQPKRAVRERCELCSIPVALQHRHLLEVESNKIICSCDGCALRFQDVIGGRFKLIPRDVRALRGFELPDAQWDSLALPISLAFFFFSTPKEKIVALYPSPAGAMESLLPLPTWSAVAATNPVLKKMDSDVEALLVNRVKTTRQYYIAPIDVCYELVGLIRMQWRGLSGGEDAWREIEAFFARLETNHA